MLIIITLLILLVLTIIVAIITSMLLKNGPSIEIVGEKLSNNTDDDIKEAVKYLKVVNKE